MYYCETRRAAMWRKLQRMIHVVSWHAPTNRLDWLFIAANRLLGRYMPPNAYFPLSEEIRRAEWAKGDGEIWEENVF